MFKQDIYRIIKLINLYIILIIFSSCEGMFGGIYDDPNKLNGEDTKKEKYGFIAYDSVSHKGKIYVKADNFYVWTYLSFKDRTFETIKLSDTLTGKWDGQSAIVYQYVHGKDFTFDTLIKTDKQIEPLSWDLALHRFEARTSNGAFQTSFTSLEELPKKKEDLQGVEFSLDECSDTLIMCDISSMFDYKIGYQKIKCSKVLSSWVNMDISTPPPIYTPSNKVYLVRFSDNSVAALHLDDYIDQKGKKGMLTISFIYPY